MNVKKDNNQIVKYKFSKPSPPAKFIRIVQTEPNWENCLQLKFAHFDIFGAYFY